MFELEYDTEMSDSKNIISVSEYINVLNNTLKQARAKIVGEVSQVKVATSGHVYFTLKDEDGLSSLECVMWSSRYKLCGINLEVGLEVVLSGIPNIYPARGSLSFVADTVELLGEGALKKAYEELKLKLDREGVFSLEKKRPLPNFPKKIGVITSKKGAVIHDFMNNLEHYGFKIIFIDSKVEGLGAIDDLIASLQRMKQEDLDVLVLIRGGGSLESLQAYNNESLVREVASFPVPVIAGIGHDQDVPLVALASDQMASTPTAVAVLLSKSWNEAKMTLQKSITIFSSLKNLIQKASYGLDSRDRYLVERVRRLIEEQKLDIQKSINVFNRIRSIIQKTNNDLNNKEIAFLSKLKNILEKTSNLINLGEQAIKLNDPHRQLSLGYSLLRKGDAVIKTIADVRVGDELSIETSDGKIISEVKQINNK